MVPETELAWAAGFFDGEGNTRWRQDQPRSERRSRSYGTFVLQISQIDRDVLDRFRAAAGCGSVYGPYIRKNGSAKEITYYSFQAVGHTAVAGFNRIRPYLSPLKREQGDAAQARFYEQKMRPRLGNGHRRRAELKAAQNEEALRPA